MNRASRPVTAALLAIFVLAACESTTVPSVAPSVAVEVPSATPDTPSGSPPESVPPTTAFHWQAPADGATSKRRVTLGATPDDAAAAEGSRVVFRVDWPDAPAQEACVATAPGDDGVWACEADLAALGAPAGSDRKSVVQGEGR